VAPIQSLGARAPSLTLAVCALLVAVGATPELGAALCYEREAAEAGEIWRFATAVLTHLSPAHLAANLAVIAPLAWWIEVRSRRALACSLAIGTITSTLLLALAPRELLEFSGASGLALALIVFAALEGAAGGPAPFRVAWSAILALTLAKLAAEAIGPLRVVELTQDVELWPPSHWAGVAAGAASFAAMRLVLSQDRRGSSARETSLPSSEVTNSSATGALARWRCQRPRGTTQTEPALTRCHSPAPRSGRI